MRLGHGSAPPLMKPSGEPTMATASGSPSLVADNSKTPHDDGDGDATTTDNERTDDDLYEIARKDFATFMKKLSAFHSENLRTFRVPVVNGREVDLQRLYHVVAAQLGGYRRVTLRQQWPDVLDAIDLPAGASNCVIAVKAIYQRFLLRYEKSNMLISGFPGLSLESDDARFPDDDEPVVSSQLSSSLRSQRGGGGAEPSSAAGDRQECMYTSLFPLDYVNQQQGVIDPQTRATYGLSDFVLPPDSDREEPILQSLLSGLPNEVDFAINIFALRTCAANDPLAFATTSPLDWPLRLCQPILLDALLSTVGVIADSRPDLIPIYERYRTAANIDYVRFWILHGVDEEQVLSLLSVADAACPRCRTSRPLGSGRRRNCQKCAAYRRDVDCMRELPAERLLACDISYFEVEMSCIQQIIGILYNLCLDRESISIIIQHEACLRFVILCCFSGIPGLRLGGMRIMNLIASRLSLSVTGSSEDERSDDVCRPSWLLEPLVRTLTLTIIESKEHQCIVDGLYLLARLATNSSNRCWLAATIEECYFERLLALLELCDAVLSLMTLEVLYHLSQLGEDMCVRIVRTNGLIPVLVQQLAVRAGELKNCIKANSLVDLGESSSFRASSAVQPHAGGFIAASQPTRLASHQQLLQTPRANIPSVTNILAQTPATSAMPAMSICSAGLLSTAAAVSALGSGTSDMMLPVGRRVRTPPPVAKTPEEVTEVTVTAAPTAPPVTVKSIDAAQEAAIVRWLRASLVPTAGSAVSMEALRSGAAHACALSIDATAGTPLMERCLRAAFPQLKYDHLQRNAGICTALLGYRQCATSNAVPTAADQALSAAQAITQSRPLSSDGSSSSAVSSMSSSSPTNGSAIVPDASRKKSVAQAAKRSTTSTTTTAKRKKQPCADGGVTKKTKATAHTTPQPEEGVPAFRSTMVKALEVQAKIRREAQAKAAATSPKLPVVTAAASPNGKSSSIIRSLLASKLGTKSNNATGGTTSPLAHSVPTLANGPTLSSAYGSATTAVGHTGSSKPASCATPALDGGRTFNIVNSNGEPLRLNGRLDTRNAPTTTSAATTLASGTVDAAPLSTAIQRLVVANGPPTMNGFIARDSVGDSSAILSKKRKL